MSVADYIPIRLQLGVISNPPLFPIDINTGLAPQFFKGETVGFELGIFDAKGASVDLTNLSFLEVSIYPMPVQNQLSDTNQRYNFFSVLPFPTAAPAPLIWQTLVAADIKKVIKNDAWKNGTDQQAVAIFPWTDTLSIDLSGEESRQFWLTVTGLTASGRKLVYGQTRLEIHESAAPGIYLPNDIAPLVVPQFTTLYIEPNQQLPFAETINVDGGQIVIEGQLVQVF